MKLNRPLETLLGNNKRAGWSMGPTNHDPTDENAPESSDHEIANQEIKVVEMWLWETRFIEFPFSFAEEDNATDESSSRSRELIEILVEENS